MVGRAAQLSVIVPAHNAERTLEAQLEALLDPPRTVRLELLVVDNGSTDGTRPVVERLAASHPEIRLVDAHERRGAGYARNVGAASAASDCLAFCDADDVVAPGWADALAGALTAHSFVTGPLETTRLNDPGLRDMRGSLATCEVPIFEEIFPFASSCNLAIHRRVFDELGGFDEAYLTGQDVELSLRLWLADVRLHFCREAVVHYRYRDSPAAIFYRARSYGTVRPLIGEQLRRAGRPTPRRLRGLRNLVWLVRHLPDLHHPAGRLKWLWIAGQRLGNLEGSIAARSLYF